MSWLNKDLFLRAIESAWDFPLPSLWLLPDLKRSSLNSNLGSGSSRRRIDALLLVSGSPLSFYIYHIDSL